jgi:Cys-tRNA(Pro)/Cys-tRNA(Cys) deacylase
MAKKKKSLVKTMPMRALEERGIPYQPRQQSHKEYTAEGVAQDLNVPVEQVVKAMLVQLSSDSATTPFILVVVPGDRRLSLKKLGNDLGDKNLQLASKRDVQRITGFQVGAVSVLGFRRDDVPAYVDQGILELDQLIISAGRPDMGIALQPSDMIKALDNPQIGEYCED